MAGISQIKIIFDRRKKASAVTTGTVEVSYNLERVRLSPGVAVLKQQWRSNQVVDHPMADSPQRADTPYAQRHVRLRERSVNTKVGDKQPIISVNLLLDVLQQVMYGYQKRVHQNFDTPSCRKLTLD